VRARGIQIKVGNVREREKRGKKKRKRKKKEKEEGETANNRGAVNTVQEKRTHPSKQIFLVPQSASKTEKSFSPFVRAFVWRVCDPTGPIHHPLAS
jgi:hypothetical protein